MTRWFPCWMPLTIPRALQGIRDEVLEMDLAVKRHMDRGLTPDEWAVAQAVREATQAALHSMDNMAKQKDF